MNAEDKRPVQLYVWSGCRANQLYTPGKMIAAAQSVDEARNTIRKVAQTGYVGYHDMTATLYEDFQKEDREKILAMMEEDLAKDPEILAIPSAILINGSE
jgi:hypothetical protein